MSTKTKTKKTPKQRFKIFLKVLLIIILVIALLCGILASVSAVGLKSNSNFIETIETALTISWSRCWMITAVIPLQQMIILR